MQKSNKYRKFKFICIQCKKILRTNINNKKFCSPECNKRYHYKNKPLKTYKCINCNNEFKSKSWNGKFCQKCREEKKYQESHFKSNGISTGTVGAIGELLVSADLMKKGYEIYRALSQSSSCDILAIKNKKTFYVEVRTGRKNANGTIQYPKNNIKGDQIAIIVHSKDNNFEIHYFPELFV